MNDSINALIHFFNDVVAQVIPGLLGLLMFSFCIDKYDEIFSWSPVMLIALTYVLGHVLLSLRDNLNSFTKVIGDKIIDKSYEKVVNLKETITYRKFEELIERQSEELSFYDTRSIAMTVSEEGAILGRRFMFISLFCEGASISILLFGPFVIAKLLYSYSINNFFPYAFIANVLLVFLVIYPLEKRAADFKRRALNTPFSCAIADLIGKKL